MNKKILIGFAAAAILLIIVVAIVLSSALDSDVLGPMLLAKASDATGVRLSAEEFDLGIFSGLEMAGVTAEGRYAEGEYRIELKRLVFEHDLGPLFAGTLAVTSILLDEPKIHLVTRSSGQGAVSADDQTSPSEQGERGGGFRLEVAEVRVDQGQITIQKETAERTQEHSLTVYGLNIALQSISFNPERVKPVQKISGKGTVLAEEVLLGSLPIRDLEGDLSVAEGIFDLSSLTLSMDQGDLEATMRVDLNPVPFEYEFSAEGEPIKVDVIVGLSENSSMGPGRLAIKGEGRGPELTDLNANGVLHLGEGEIPTHPILVQTQSVLGIQNLVGGTYQSSDAQFTIENGRVDLSGFSLETPQAGLDIAGWVTLAGPLEIDIGVRTPREGVSIPNVPSALLDTLADDNGWLTVPVEVTGTLEDSKVLPDVDALVGQAGRGATRQLKNLLGLN
ncbi:MAG TPA: AsmA-like C-terminal region-containing protein [Acidobacteriota bacterium]|nr:AsmA-like C-terminal region-containing protein [Acidobacteriota bacterium]